MRKDYKEMWRQLKALVLLGDKKRYTQREVFKIMTNLELLQLGQDPIGQIVKVYEAEEKE